MKMEERGLHYTASQIVQTSVNLNVGIGSDRRLDRWSGVDRRPQFVPDPVRPCVTVGKWDRVPDDMIPNSCSSASLGEDASARRSSVRSEALHQV